MIWLLVLVAVLGLLLLAQSPKPPEDEKPAGKSLYVIGSMRNPRIPQIANVLRSAGYDAFDDWFSPGPDTDERWQEHESVRGRTFREALAGWHAQDVFNFDKRHLDRWDAAVLVLPAGK